MVIRLVNRPNQIEFGLDVFDPILNPVEAPVDARQSFFDACHSDFDVAHIFFQHAKIAADGPKMLKNKVSHYWNALSRPSRAMTQTKYDKRSRFNK
jgi:hypothetical protein